MARLFHFSACLMFALFCSWQVQAKPRPVIVIPGVMGSKLCNANGEIVWGDRSSYSASRIKALRLPPNLRERDPGVRPCGLIETVSIIPLFWESDVYVELLGFLRGLGYDDEDIVRFDYDWRLSNFENAALLQKRIEQIGSGQKVDIVAHSMGGIIARIYYQSLGGRDHVGQLIMLGAPFEGSAKIFERLSEGFENWPDALSGGLSEIQSTILSFPSTYQLLPTYSECCGLSTDGNPVTAQYVDPLSIEFWNRLEIPEEFKSGSYRQALTNYLSDARKLRTLFHSPIGMEPGDSAKVHFIANGFLETWSRVFFQPLTGKITGHTLSPGDGSVLLFSATDGIPALVQMSSREHEKIFVGDGPELVIKAALSDVRWTAGSYSFEQTIWDSRKRSYRIKSGQLDISQRITAPDQPLVMLITLHGGPELASADLANFGLEISTNGPGRRIEVAPTQEHGPNSVTVSFAINAPHDPGAYSLRAVLPGLPSFSVPFAVVVP
ncbi:esterase/lipase family protein [Rhizobium ruizarguesonis]|uniref:esterase/lipase family protein n=1 Tax=Rhizobium ruizarguesonis TaxID=2081791 RepID=UPI00095BA352|nr:alpha/beta fold hydrolase [Rhizobium ruizarguesonis]UED34248.1 alpha/beta fold hydrolase [Rhizobium ruizarguesonis]